VSCLHAIHNFPPVTHTAATSYDPFGSSSSSSYPPVTTALLYALVLFSSRSISAEVKREMGLIAYYIIDQQQYWRSDTHTAVGQGEGSVEGVGGGGGGGRFGGGGGG